MINKKLTIETILVVISAPLVAWFIGFVASSYEIKAQVGDQKDDIKEIKQDVKDIKTFLIKEK